MKTENFTTSQEASFSAWNPGIVSNIPQEYQSLETIYQQENVFTSQQEVEELCRETGLSQEELVQFRPARLVLHELIVRVSANIVVRKDENEEDLGILFREIAKKIYDHYIQPELAGIEENFYILEKRLSTLVDRELENLLFAPASTPQKTPWYSLFKPVKSKPKKSQETTAEKEFRLIASFREKGLNHGDPEEAGRELPLRRTAPQSTWAWKSGNGQSRPTSCSLLLIASKRSGVLPTSTARTPL